MVKEIRGRSGAGSGSAHGLAPQNLSPDKHVDVCVDSEEDRGSTPLASISHSNSQAQAAQNSPGNGFVTSKFGWHHGDKHSTWCNRFGRAINSRSVTARQ